jgi:xylan 1,4-beta-xylosidase
MPFRKKVIFLNNNFEYAFMDNDFPVRIFLQKINHYKLHWHNHIEIIYALNGSIQMTTNGVNFKLDKGHICFINSGVIHSTSRGDEDNLILTIHITDSKKSVFYNFKNMKFNAETYLDNFQRNLVPLTELQHLLTEIYREYRSKLPGYENMILSHINACFAIMIRRSYLVPKEKDDFIGEDNLKRFNLILDYINEHYAEKLSLQKLADAMHMNYYYLSHFFKDIAGISFQEYINGQRLNQSEILLSATDKTITQIALESGYPNIKAFTAAFKANFGMIPTHYRKMLKETAAVEDSSADNDIEI